jgi:hypothetical protein
MAARYWVGTGTWDSSATTNWSAAPGISLASASCSGTTLTTTASPPLTVGMTVFAANGTSLGTISSGSVNTWVVTIGGTYTSQTMVAGLVTASAPTSADAVTIDANSADGQTTTIGTGAVCQSLAYSHNGTIAFGSNSITISGNNTTVINSSTLTTITGTPTLNFNYSGSTGTRSITVPAAKAGSPQLNINITAGGDIINLGSSVGIGDLIFTGFSGTWTFPSVVSMYGSLTLSTGMTTSSSTQALTFAATTGTQTITSNTRTINFPVIFSGGATRQLADNLTLGSSRLTIDAGTFNAGIYNVTCSSFYATGTTARTINMGSGLWTITGTGNPWEISISANINLNKDTANILLSSTSTNSREFRGGSKSYNKLTIGGATGISITTIANINNTFTELASTKTVAHIIAFGNPQTINTWSVKGTAGNVVTVASSTAGTIRNLTITNKSTGIDYLNIQDINSVNATPVTFWAGANSTNSGNNQGVAFADGTTTQAYILTTGTSFTTPGDWNNASNFIYLIGGGGGGAGCVNSTDTPANSRAGGAGGGGGGFTLLTNQTISGAVAYAIGAAGANGSGNSGAGTRTSTGGTGGTTTWNTTNTATGGTGGVASTLLPSSTGGIGGTGTYTGGTGGIGGVIVANSRVSGGGGGGAAGVNGNGGNGGNGNGNTTITAGDESAGGGGGNGGGTPGGNGVAGTSGAGGNNSLGLGGGAAVSNANGNNGVRGGGSSGAEGTGFRGGLGGNGADILNGFGSGGGSGGSTTVSNASATPGLYGGGGGGAGFSGTAVNGVAGRQGAIILVYTLGGAPAVNSNFFFLFG